MSHLITVASGKGGVGKSVTAANLAVAMAALGRRVVLADLDIGGANQAALFGSFELEPDLNAFLQRDIEELGDALHPIRPRLQLLPGAGRNLATAHPTWAMKRRVLRHLRALPVDVVVADLGAGAGRDALDLFLAGDERILVTLPQPAAAIDGYRFLKLAAMRAAALQLSSRDPKRRQLERSQLPDANAYALSVGERREPAPLLRSPWVVENQAQSGRGVFRRLQRTAASFLGEPLKLLARIPHDPKVAASVLSFMPVVEASPDAPSACAYMDAAMKLSDEVSRRAVVSEPAARGVARGRATRRPVGSAPSVG